MIHSLQSVVKVIRNGRIERAFFYYERPMVALKSLQAETAAELDALLPALLDRAFKGEL